ncbi:MAG: double zinc ribbon domain-containing protein [Bacteroides sp.]|nr:double zinc ribbon domain-containing protein [Bacteroides sp.]
MKKSLTTWIDLLLSLLYPRTCLVCEGRISSQEKILCTACNMQLPRISHYPKGREELEKLFWGKAEIRRVSSWFYYTKGSRYRSLIYQLKYNGYKASGEILGSYMATELQAENFFEGIDLLVPVPLHPQKLKERGYNQSQWIARGVSRVTNIPVATGNLYKHTPTSSQTRKSVYDRHTHTAGTFALCDKEQFRDKHILMVDDVLTTGATLTACSRILLEIPGTQVSILTLAAVN